MMFENIIMAKGNPRIQRNKNLGFLEIKDNKMILSQDKFVKYIYYADIKSVEKKRGILIILIDDSQFTLSFPIGRGLQSAKNAGRKGLMLMKIIKQKKEEFDPIVLERNKNR